MSQSTIQGSLSFDRPIVTVQQHILQERHRRFPQASGEFSWLLSGLTLATKMIHAKVSRAGLSDILGSANASNVQGETQQKLDVFANRALLHCMGFRESVGALISEEDEEPVILQQHAGSARYAVIFDPLDGSSNIDVNVSVGTIFSIIRMDPTSQGQASFLQPGSAQVAAGYVLYGSSTVLVYTAGFGVHGFTLDPAVGAYVLSHENIRMPESGPYYSTNEAYIDDYPAGCQEYIRRLRKGALGRKYGSRYVGSLVADFHRTLLKGGVFLYPPTAANPTGKLRLLYEANPIAFLATAAGGLATDGQTDIMNIHPTSIHQRTPLFVGGKGEMEALAACLADHNGV